MEWLIQKGKVEPYPNGTQLQWKATNKKATLQKQCGCTDKWLHYEVLTDGQDLESIFDHPDIERLFVIVK
jgi:hypothetical protein